VATTRASTWSHRAVVTGMVLVSASLILRVLPELPSVPDVERRMEATYLYLIYSVYAGLLAQFIVWKVGDRREGQSLAVLMGIASLIWALSVTPRGEAGAWARWAIVFCVSGVFIASIRFWVAYPQVMELDAVRRLDAGPRGKSWFGAVNRATAYAVVKMLESPVVKAVYVAAAFIFAFELSAPGSYRYNVFLRNRPVAEEMLLNGVGLPAVLISVAFAWTAFRLATPLQKTRVLWILFAQLIGGLWVFLAVSLGWLAGYSDSGAITLMADVVVGFYAPVNTAIGLTGFAVGIFYSGAFDLRPLINKTTIYTGVLLLLAFVFAAVEELVESQVATRLNVSDGLGSWIGAAAVGAAFGPLSKKVERLVRRIGAALDPPTDAEGASPPTLRG